MIGSAPGWDNCATIAPTAAIATPSVAAEETVFNAVVLVVAGAMEAGLASLLFRDRPAVE